MRDLYNQVGVKVAIAAAALNADNTPPAVDLAGFESAVLVLAIGVGGIVFDATNKIEFKLTHSDDDSTYTPVTDADVQLPAGASVGEGGIVKSLVAEHAAASVTKIGYIGGRRYTKLLADFSGTHGSATTIAATWVLSDPHVAPVA